MITGELIKSKAYELGFQLVGFAKAKILEKEIKHLEQWIWDGFNAGMKYMERNIEKRKDVTQILPEAKSVISLGINYYYGHKHIDKLNSGKISRYAWGKDYHLIVREKIDELVSQLKKIDSSLKAIGCVDTGPVMDKSWAVKSGLGWLGKNTNVINKNFGSWFVIATIISNIELSDSKQEKDLCGKCTACIDACPTKALLPEGYILDSNKCISYLTIENKNEISEEFRGKFNNWIFGCDICQDVCPWNKKFSVQTKEHNFRPINTELELDEIFTMKEEEFKNKFKETPLLRTKLKGLKRNASFLKNGL